MPTPSSPLQVSLPPRQARYVRDLVNEGRFPSADDVVLSGLQLLEEREARLRDLRQFMEDGRESGEPRAVDLDDLLVRAREEHTRRRSER